MNNYDNENDQYSYHYTYEDLNRPGPGPSTPPPGRPSGSGNDILSWIVDIALLFAVPPLGLILTISHALGTNILGRLFSRVSAGNVKTRSKAAYTRHTSSARVGKAPAQEAQSTAAQAAPVSSVKPVEAGSSVMNVFGWILAIFGLLFVLGSAGAVWRILTGVCMVLGGGSLVYSAFRSKNKAKAFARCIKVSGTEGIVNIGKLAATLGIKSSVLDKQLTEMIDRGYYGPKAYIDHQRGLLVINPEDMRDVYRREDEAKAADARRSEEANISEYERIIAQIRQADIDIEDEAMSEKIRRMEASTAAIFKEVEAHPEKRGQITRFMNYYLPTTLKLLNSYARIEAQGVSGENMAKAKADIERIADTLVAGYEKQLDTLYRAEAMDIAGDVGVIEKMLNRDGFAADSIYAAYAAESSSQSGAAAAQAKEGN